MSFNILSALSQVSSVDVYEFSSVEKYLKNNE